MPVQPGYARCRRHLLRLLLRHAVPALPLPPLQAAMACCARTGPNPARMLPPSPRVIAATLLSAGRRSCNSGAARAACCAGRPAAARVCRGRGLSLGAACAPALRPPRAAGQPRMPVPDSAGCAAQRAAAASRRPPRPPALGVMLARGGGAWRRRRAGGGGRRRLPGIVHAAALVCGVHRRQQRQRGGEDRAGAAAAHRLCCR